MDSPTPQKDEREPIHANGENGSRHRSQERGCREILSTGDSPERGVVERFSLRETPEVWVVERFSLWETPQRCGCRDNLDSPLWKTPQMGLFRPHLSIYLDGCGCFGGVRESAFWLQRILVRPNSEERPTQHSRKTGTTNHGASRLKPWTCPVPRRSGSSGARSLLVFRRG